MKLLKISLTPPLTAISAVLCAAVSFSAFGATFTVPADGTLTDVIAEANKSADASSEVVVSPGEYKVDACLTVSKPVTIRSSTGDPKDVKVYTTANIPIFYLTDAGATLSGLCVSNGYGLAATQLGGNVSMPNGGTVTNCWIAHGRGVNKCYAGGIYMKDGVVTHSRIYNNTVSGTESKTAGIYTEGNNSVIEHCEIYGNYYADSASGGLFGVAVQMFGGTVRYCIMTNNIAAPAGFRTGTGALFITSNANYPTFLIDHCLIADTVNGYVTQGSAMRIDFKGPQLGYIRNCTISGNYTMNAPAVSGHAKLCLENTIVWGNRRGLEDSTTTPDITVSSLVAANQLNNCFPTPKGAVCIATDPCFVDPAHGDYRLSKNSPCIGAGTNGCDIGCFAYVPAAFECGIDYAGITPTAARTGSFTAMARGTDATDVTFSWKVNGGEWTEYSAETAATLDFATGRNTVHLRAKNGAGTVVEGEREVIVAPKTVYLSKTSTPAEPYDDPAIAANDFKAALAFCAAGTTLVVDDGDYGVDGEAVVDQDVTIRSVNGPAKTSIYRIGKQNDANARQCRVMRVRTAGTVLSGLTLSNGCFSVTKTVDSASCLLMNGATMTNCVVTKNWLTPNDYRGGAVWSNGGKIYNSIIENNTGGGKYGGGLRMFGTNPLIVDSIVRNHTASAGSNCGGGICAEAGAIERCVISNNVAGTACHGGGIFCGGAIKVENTLIAKCSIPSYKDRGGGAISVNVSGGTFANCTFADCTAGYGGGINFALSSGVPYSATVVNCIFSGCQSTSVPDAPDYQRGENSTFLNCCFSTAAQATGESPVVYNPATDKLYTDQPHGDYTLAKGSVVIDKGADYAWLHELDLALTNRVMGTAPDIGAYEYPPAAGLSVTYEVAGLDRVAQDVTFTAKPSGDDLTGLQFRWKLVDQADPDSAEWTDWSDSPVYVLVAGNLGNFKMTVEAKNDAGETAEYDNDGTVVKTPCPLMFLAPQDAEGVVATFPYATRTTAATNIADLLPYVANGTEIIALKGRHALTGATVFNGATKFHGEGAPEETLFYRANNEYFRCFAMNVAGGEFFNVAVSNAFQSGSTGNALQISDGVVSNCLFTNCKSASVGSAAVDLTRSTMRNCTITKCQCDYHYGTALYVQDGSLVEDCFITDNYGRGYNASCTVRVSGGRLSRTVIARNRMEGHENAPRDTPGVILEGISRMENCLVCDNTTDGYCGGVFCGGSSGSQAIVNCTIVSNTAALGPGGVRFMFANSVATNTLVYGNVCETDPVQNNIGYFFGETVVSESPCKVRFSHCDADNLDAVDPLLTIEQEGCFYADPKFRNFDRGNYRIKGTGPCRDAGADIEWPADAKDLDGKGRVKFSHVDIGCYECQTAGMLLLVR